MRIKVLEETGIRYGGTHLHHEDEVTLPDELGAEFCRAGWAEDLAGKVPTGERDTRPKVADPNAVKTAHGG